MAEYDYPTDFRRIVGMDPAANWLLGDAIDDYLEDVGNPQDPTKPCIAFLIEFTSDAAIDAFNKLEPMKGDPSSNGVVILGMRGEELRPGVLVAAVTSPAWFTRLLNGTEDFLPEFRRAPKRIVLSSPVIPPENLTANYPDFPRFWSEANADESVLVGSPPTDWPDGTVIVAVIDDGIAFAHERLRLDNDVSRVEYFWNMKRPLRPALTSLAIPDPGALPGELTRDDIERYMASSRPGGVVDEDLAYLKSGLIAHSDPLHKSAAWRRSHGAHVLDLAAGADPSENVCNRPIIAVQLPSPIVAHTVDDYLLDAHLWLAIVYVLDRAGRLAGKEKTLPLVINTSFGYIAGPHDGSGVLEVHMDNDVPSTTRIALPAGNAHLSRCHAAISFTDNNPVAFDWIVQPNDRTHSVVQVWLPGPTSPQSRMMMTVTPPGGPPATVTETAGSRVIVFDGAGRAVGHMQFDTFAGRSLFRLDIRPTDRPQPSTRAVAPAGRWRLRFDGVPGQLLGGVAHAWVQRDDSLYGYPQAGRQSYFDDSNYRAFDENGWEICDDEDPPQPQTPSSVRRKSLLNAIATGRHVITAGGYLEWSGGIARYSAGGPSTPPLAGAPLPAKPDLLLPSEGSKAHVGILAAGSRSGARVAMSGTSVASPQLARWVADRMGTGQPTDRATMAQAALLEESPNAPLLPADRGAGRAAGRYRLPAQRFLRGY
jgi:hypothetical protein